MKINDLTSRIGEKNMGNLYKTIEDMYLSFKSEFLSLDVKEKRRLIKMSDKRIRFMQKVIHYAETNPEFIPNSMNKTIIDEAMVMIAQLESSHKLLEELVQQMDDTKSWMHSEIYSDCLTYYQLVKAEARKNTKSSVSIYNDLKKYFAKSSASEENNEESIPEHSSPDV